MRQSKFVLTPIAVSMAIAFSGAAMAQSQTANSTNTAAAQQTLPTVLITANPDADQSKKQVNAERALTPGGVTVIESEDIALRNVTGLSDMLRYAPGVWSTNGVNADGTFLSIRGSNLDSTNYDGSGIVMLVDGLPVTAADGNNHNRDVDPLARQRAIILRGANALTYGASTLGGAINFISPTARDGAPNEVSVRGGSHGELQTRVTVGQVFGKSDALVTVEDKKSDGFRAHAKQDRQSLYGNFGVQLSESVATRFYVTSIKNDQQLPGGLTRAEFNANPRQAEDRFAASAIRGDYRLDVNTQRFANRTTIDLGAGRKLVAGVSVEEQDLFHPIYFAPWASFMKVEKTKNKAGHVRYQQQEADHDFVMGLDLGSSKMTGGYYTYTTHSNRNLSTAVDNGADNIAVFAVDRWSFAPKWKLVYGAQAIHTKRSIKESGWFTTLDETYSSINPRMGLIHDLTSNTQLYSNISRAYEPPTLFQTKEYANGNATGRAVKATNGIVYEVGARGQSSSGGSRMYWDTAIYYTKLNDEILSISNNGTTNSFNADKTVHAGVEALIGGSISLGSGHQIAPLVSATFNRFNFVNDATYGNNKLPAAPTYAIRGELLYKHANGIFAGPTFDMIGSRYADYSSTYKVDAYSLWGLRAGYSEKAWEVYGELRNASDKSYVSYTGVNGTQDPGAAILYPGAGRALYAGAKFRF
jgi:iron complex outermembrane receptor protein